MKSLHTRLLKQIKQSSETSPTFLSSKLSPLAPCSLPPCPGNFPAWVACRWKSRSSVLWKIFSSNFLLWWLLKTSAKSWALNQFLRGATRRAGKRRKDLRYFRKPSGKLCVSVVNVKTTIDIIKAYRSSKNWYFSLWSTAPPLRISALRPVFTRRILLSQTLPYNLFLRKETRRER